MLKRLQPLASRVLQDFGHKGPDILASNRAERFKWKERERLPFLPPGTSEPIVGKVRKQPLPRRPIHTYPPTEFVALSVAAPGVERRMMRQDDGTLLTFASRSEAREWVGGLAVVPMRTAKQRGYV